MSDIFEEGTQDFVADGAWIPEELKGEESLKEVHNFSDLTKGYVEAQKTIGKKGVIIPADDASEDEVNAFHAAMGRPATSKEYKFDKPTLPDGMEFDEKMDAGFREFAFKNGFSQKKAAAASDWYNKTLIDAFNGNTKAIQDNQVEQKRLLTKKWGKDAEANFAAATNAFKKYVPDPVKQEAFGKLGDNPILLETFLQISKGMKEDTEEHGGDNTNKDLIAEIKKIKLDVNHPFNKENDAGHAQAVKDMDTMYATAYPKLAQSA